MKNTIAIKCFCCGKIFQKELRRIHENIKRGNNSHYCSRTCQREYSLSNKLDEFSKFRKLYKRAKNRGKDFNIDLKYLKDLWESQDGRCAITGVKLELMVNGNKNYQASLDRIDSKKGYVKGNIRFTSVSVNYLKNDLDDVHLREFMEICKNH